ncbi:MAG: glycosyltransferase family 2 protein [Candidatus Limnocylindrales bacterium]
MAERTAADRLRRRLGRLVTGASALAPGRAGHDQGGPGPRNGRKRVTPGRMLRAKPPNIRGRGPLVGGPPLTMAVVAIVKDEAEYLEEWLAFHLALGVDHFFIYDNGSTDGSAELLERYINHGLVTCIDWPMGGGQLSAYNHSLRMFGTTAEWIGYFDPDEFLVPIADDDIPTFLARYPDAAALRIPRLEYGFSGHRTRPAGLSIDSYTHVANVLQLDPELPPRVKSVVRPRTMAAVDVHLAFPADAPEPGQPTRTYEAELRGVVQLNHYYTRSWEEFEAKRFRGSATGRIARPAVEFDVPTIEINDRASRYSGRTRAMISRLRSLDPKPYQYGSQIGFEYFPRPNGLFRFAEFAVANYAAGLVEPRRDATVRLKNRYGGVGLVADISDLATQPVRDGLSSSSHCEALVEHMRGRIVNGLSVAPDLPIAATTGALEAPEGEAARLQLVEGGAEVDVALPADEMLRCYHLGLLAAADGPVKVCASVGRADGTRGTDTELELPAATSVAAVVEVEPTPQAGATMHLRFESEAVAVTLYDLFVIATG